MSVVLGIDAAWSEAQPSGVAVVLSSADAWRCAGVAPSYEAFMALAAGVPVDWESGRFRGTKPDARALLAAAHSLAGEQGRHANWPCLVGPGGAWVVVLRSSRIRRQ